MEGRVAARSRPDGAHASYDISRSMQSRSSSPHPPVQRIGGGQFDVQPGGESRGGLVMPTSSEIAESLVRLRPSQVNESARTTLDAASQTLISQEPELLAERDKQHEDDYKRIAELEKRLLQISAAAVEDDELTLVASGGAEISMKASVARSASSYFDTALEAGGFRNRRMDFADVSIAALRFIVSGVHAGEAGANLLAMPSPLDAAAVVEIVSFSIRLSMPWLAHTAVRRALESSNAAMLADLLLVADDRMQHQQAAVRPEEFSLLEELSQSAQERLALLSVAHDGKTEALGWLPLKTVERILGLVKEPEWQEWREVASFAEGTLEVVTTATDKGLSLVSRSVNGKVHFVWSVDEDVDEPVVIVGKAFVGFEYEIEFKQQKLEGATIFQTGFLQPGIVMHGYSNSSKPRFRIRRSKLHVQCRVLLERIKLQLPSESQAEPRLLASALELLRSSEGLEDLHAMLVGYLARAFCGISKEEQVLGELSCRNMEAIITHKDLATEPYGQILVLAGILQWAQGPGQLTPSLGGKVRVRDDSELRGWCGEECRVVRKASDQWEIKRTSDGVGGTLIVQESDLLCLGHVDVERLLGHVKFPLIEMQVFESKLLPLLSREQGNLIKKSPAFRSGITHAFQLQLLHKIDEQSGKRKTEERGVRVQKRARCTSDTTSGS